MGNVNERNFTEKKKKKKKKNKVEEIQLANLSRPSQAKIKALLGMLARLPWGKRDVLGSINGKYEGVSVKYASLIFSCHWIKVFITA